MREKEKNEEEDVISNGCHVKRDSQVAARVAGQPARNLVVLNRQVYVRLQPRLGAQRTFRGDRVGAKCAPATVKAGAETSTAVAAAAATSHSRKFRTARRPTEVGQV